MKAGKGLPAPERPTSMVDFAVLRQNMVKAQLRTNEVTEPRLLEAMEEIPREIFVPERSQAVAYVDEDIEIGLGRYLMEPMVLARLLQAAEVTPRNAALDIGCATGYSSAVLARLAGAVVAVESEPELAARADELLTGLGADNVAVVRGALEDGYAKQAPYDVILLGGAVPELPQTIIDQLAEGGRLLAVMRAPGEVGRATLTMRRQGAVSSRTLFDAAVPPLPGFERRPRFVF